MGVAGEEEEAVPPKSSSSSSLSSLEKNDEDDDSKNNAAERAAVAVAAAAEQVADQEQTESSASTEFTSDRNFLGSASLIPSAGTGAGNAADPATQLHLLHQQQQQLQLQQHLPAALLQPLGASIVTHNLIPSHLQASTLAASLNGTPGHPSALIPLVANPNHPTSSENRIEDPIPPPALTVQDRPMTPPVYNGVNPKYPGLRVVHSSPPIFAVDNFLNPAECEFLIRAAQDSFGPAPVVGKGAGEVSPSRTSSTCYLAREDLPDLLRKVSILTGKPFEHCELPQVGRYLPTQQYLQHYDAFDLGNEDGRRFAANGGQRTITVLIYLNDVLRGGATRFPALNLDVQPRAGMALVFFPATIDGLLDKMALHAALPAVDVKFVSQVWIRQSTYSGQPTKRLPQTMGVPFGAVAASTHGTPQHQPHHEHYQHQHQQQQQQQQSFFDNQYGGRGGSMPGLSSHY